MIPLSSKSSNIHDKSELGKGYFFYLSSFNVGCFLPPSLEHDPFFSSRLDFPEICTGFSTKVVMVSFIDALEGLELFLVSPLSFLNS